LDGLHTAQPAYRLQRWLLRPRIRRWCRARLLGPSRPICDPKNASKRARRVGNGGDASIAMLRQSRAAGTQTRPFASINAWNGDEANHSTHESVNGPMQHRNPTSGTPASPAIYWIRHPPKRCLSRSTHPNVSNSACTIDCSLSPWLCPNQHPGALPIVYRYRYTQSRVQDRRSRYASDRCLPSAQKILHRRCRYALTRLMIGPELFFSGRMAWPGLQPHPKPPRMKH
jgi:hypothetical protein